MKTILIILTFFVSSLFQILEAQDLSTFYKVSNKEHIVDIKEATTKTIQLESISDETIDIKFSMTLSEKIAKGTKMTINLGNSQTLDITVHFDSHKPELRSNGQLLEENYFLHYGDYDDVNKLSTTYLLLRISKDGVRPFFSGEMGGVVLSKKLPLDNRDINIKIETSGKAKFAVAVNTRFLHTLNCFSDNGLKIRQTPDLKSKQVGSIPFREQVYVLDNIDKEDLYNGWSADTQGDLKVGQVSSKMIKVLYKDKIGYAYGGFLMPFEPLDKSNKKAIGLQGWSTKGLEAEEVYHQKQLVLQNMYIEFKDGKYGDMDVSQRKLLLTKLFPQAFTMDKLNQWCLANETIDIELNDGDFTAFYKLKIEDNQVSSLRYQRMRKGFPSKVVNFSTAYVTASQLNMRNSIHPKSEIITKIPMNGKVTVLKEASSDFMVIGGIHGKMIKVKYNNQEGYVFDAYLSPVSLVDDPGSIREYEISKIFKETVIKRGFQEWEHRSEEENEWSDKYMIINSRDKFQTIKTLRNFHPLINDLSFTWNKNNNDYIITSSDSAIFIDKNKKNGDWYISKETDDGTLIIIVKTLAKNLQKITITFEEIGC